MITDADIQKLKAVFATKDDLVAMEKRFDKKFATKDDLIQLRKAIVKDVVDFLQGEIIPILNEYEKRLDRLEKRVGGFPSIA